MRLPCVNRSLAVFTPEDGAIRTGLEAIVGFPQEATATILRQRERQGPFGSLTDFCRRLPLGPQALAQLICCARSTGPDEPGQLYFLKRLCTMPCAIHRRTCSAAISAANGRRQTMASSDGWHDEWRLLEFVLGPPLLSLFRRPLPPDKNAPLIRSDELSAYRGRRVRVYGLVATARHAFTADDRPLQFVTLEDEHGLVEVTLFPGTCPQVAYLMMGPYLASGLVDDHYGVLTVTADKFERFTGV